MLERARLGKLGQLQGQGQGAALEDRIEMPLHHVEQRLGGVAHGLGIAARADLDGGVHEGVVVVALGHAILIQAQGARTDAARREQAGVDQDAVDLAQQAGHVAFLGEIA